MLDLRHDLAVNRQDAARKINMKEDQVLSEEFLRRVLISACLYLFIAVAMMGFVVVLDQLEPLETDSQIVLLDTAPTDGPAVTSAAPWTTAN